MTLTSASFSCTRTLSDLGIRAMPPLIIQQNYPQFPPIPPIPPNSNKPYILNNSEKNPTGFQSLSALGTVYPPIF